MQQAVRQSKADDIVARVHAIAAEARMTESCGYLTRAVLAHLEGNQPSLGLKFKVMNSIDECERSAQKIEQMLKATDVVDAAADSI